MGPECSVLDCEPSDTRVRSLLRHDKVVQRKLIAQGVHLPLHGRLYLLILRGLEHPVDQLRHPDEFVRVAEMIDRVLQDPEDQDVQSDVEREVNALCDQFPLYDVAVA